MKTLYLVQSYNKTTKFKDIRKFIAYKIIQSMHPGIFS